ncbi:MAG: 2-oxo acid dehydrogenase subunit E2, partial [Gammaproteobacteria bacterium]|nr:2-oxo acid dehydrogenase subunit E2 [Gammaproteobacteria bacterium]
GPAVRRLARELGVDLTKVNGSGSKGRITKDDVHAYVKAILTSGVQQGSLPEVKYPDFTKFGEVELQPMSRMRSVGAENLVRSWLNVVHVTQFDTTDVTDLEAKRKQLNEDSLAKGESTKLTPLPFIIRACALTLKAYPQFNASIHPSLTQLILKKYMHMGFAVDTDEGLIVPVIRDVLDKDLYELSNEVATLSDAARRRRLRPDQISGATFTISSLGRLGGTGFAPVVNAPEVGILGVARMETRPVWNGESFEPRSILPISLSYDHRAINGAEAGRFLQAVCQRIADVSDY